MHPVAELTQGMSVVTLGLLGSLAAGLMTGLGALPVLFTRNFSRRLESLMLGFGGGVMLAATAFSLIVPGIEAAERQTGTTTLAALIVAAAMLLGGVALWAANLWIAHRDFGEGPYDVAADRVKGIWLFVVAITLHNFPEGMAVGVGFAGGDVANGTSLAIGIGLQNVPEGLAVAVSLAAGGYAPLAAFGIGLLSGVVEPVGGLIGVGVVAVAQPLLPWGLGFAAGAMLFVTSQEVIPEIHQGKRSSLNTFGLMVGFVVMMMLDVILG